MTLELETDWHRIGKPLTLDWHAIDMIRLASIGRIGIRLALDWHLIDIGLTMD